MEFQRAGHVQGIKRSQQQAGPEFARQISTNFEGSIWKGSFLEQACRFIRKELRSDALRWVFMQIAAKLMLCQCVEPFCPVEGSQNKGWRTLNSAASVRRVDIC